MGWEMVRVFLYKAFCKWHGSFKPLLVTDLCRNSCRILISPCQNGERCFLELRREFTTWSPGNLKVEIDWEGLLVGGFNPFEKYSSKWTISPGRGENKIYSKPPPRLSSPSFNNDSCVQGASSAIQMGRPPTSRSRKNPMAAAAWEAAWKVQCPIPRDCPSCEKAHEKCPKKHWHSKNPENEQMSIEKGFFQKENSLPIQSAFF